jgi:hypothetical protein
MPVKDCAAREMDGVTWVQPDAPRHLVLYTRAGLEASPRTKQGSIRQRSTMVHGAGFQFWGSELVQQGKAHAGGPVGFSADQLEAWGQQARALNAAGRGDSIVAVCRAMTKPRS